MTLRQLDHRILLFTRKISLPLARVSLFVVFFWFGLLKVLGYSPAAGLVKDLLARTLPFLSPETFVVCFGLFEMLIGILFLIKGCERFVIPLLFLHMLTTILPLILLPSVTWSQAFVPTLEGQYIIKNIVIIATAIGIMAHLRPIKIPSSF